MPEPNQVSGIPHGRRGLDLLICVISEVITSLWAEDDVMEAPLESITGGLKRIDIARLEAKSAKKKYTLICK